jgi:GalNAc-alpha-(1->4)-GalNAc-alpha-(1->3)-diNAcBac-PP-undecaprenol alpha-1,4-N-acetyl-D-galactosaminyltransferase
MNSIRDTGLAGPAEVSSGKKRILFFVSSMHAGGAERVAALLCNQWVAQGHQVMLVPTFSGKGACEYPLDERVQLVYLADRVKASSKAPFSLFRRLSMMRSMMREFPPDVIVSFLPHVNVATLLASYGLGVPVIVSERTYPPAMPIGPIWPRLRRWTYPLATAVVMQTSRGQEWLGREIPSAAVCVIENPCVYPLPQGSPVRAPEAWVGQEIRVLVAVGRLGIEKGFDRLIDAFAHLKDQFPDWHLVILGEGEQRAALESQIKALTLEERVHLPGRVGNLADWYERAELYVLSSRFEGFPNTLLEAMAHGLPAVSFDCDTGPRDIIRHQTDGLLVPPQSGSQGLESALACLMADKATRKRMGKASLEVRDRFSMDHIASKWENVLGLRIR